MGFTRSHPDGSSIEDIQKLKANEINLLQTLLAESQKRIEERYFQLSTGGLSITFTIVTLGFSNNAQFGCIYLGIGAIVFYAVCLVLTLISHRLSIERTENCIKSINRLPSEEQSTVLSKIEDVYHSEYKPIHCLNKALLWLLPFAIVLSISFLVSITF